MIYHTRPDYSTIVLGIPNVSPDFYQIFLSSEHLQKQYSDNDYCSHDVRKLLIEMIQTVYLSLKYDIILYR